jgi:hypothetical protein
MALPRRQPRLEVIYQSGICGAYVLSILRIQSRDN